MVNAQWQSFCRNSDNRSVCDGLRSLIASHLRCPRVCSFYTYSDRFGNRRFFGPLGEGGITSIVQWNLHYWHSHMHFSKHGCWRVLFSLKVSYIWNGPCRPHQTCWLTLLGEVFFDECCSSLFSLPIQVSTFCKRVPKPHPKRQHFVNTQWTSKIKTNIEQVMFSNFPPKNILKGEKHQMFEGFCAFGAPRRSCTPNQEKTRKVKSFLRRSTCWNLD